jgi:hypothetical protein
VNSRAAMLPARGLFEWDFKFGLYSTPYREVAIQAMKANYPVRSIR